MKRIKIVIKAFFIASIFGGSIGYIEGFYGLKIIEILGGISLSLISFLISYLDSNPTLGNE